MSKKYLIYKHENNINGKIYIGCTCRTINSRAGKQGVNYHLNKRFWEDIQKYGWDNFSHIVLFDNIQTLQEASNLENKMINEYKSYNPLNGYNIHSVSNASNSCKSTRAKKVYQYNLNGEYIREWESMNQAAIYCKCDSSQISRSCRVPQNQAGGFLWSTEKKERLDKFVKRFYDGPVFCFNKNKILIRFYKNPDDIIKENPNYKISEIRRCLIGDRKTYEGYIWSKSICQYTMVSKEKYKSRIQKIRELKISR